MSDIYRPSVSAVGDASDATYLTEGVDYTTDLTLLGTITLPALPLAAITDPYNLWLYMRWNAPGTIPRINITGTDALGAVLFTDYWAGRAGVGAGTTITSGTAPIYTDVPYTAPVTITLSWNNAGTAAGSATQVFDWWADATLPEVVAGVSRDWSRAHIYLPQLDLHGALLPHLQATFSQDGSPSTTPLYSEIDGVDPEPSIVVRQPGILDLWTDDPVRLDIAVSSTSLNLNWPGIDFYPDPFEIVLGTNRLTVGADAPRPFGGLIAQSATTAHFKDLSAGVDEVVGDVGATVGFFDLTSPGIVQGTITDGTEDGTVTELLTALDGLGLLIKA